MLVSPLLLGGGSNAHAPIAFWWSTVPVEVQIARTMARDDNDEAQVGELSRPSPLEKTGSRALTT